MSELAQIDILNEEHVLSARGLVRRLMLQHFQFTPLERMQIITAVSELARNIFIYASSGQMRVSLENSPDKKRGIQIIFQDNGPGIENIEKAMQPKSITEYSRGMGLGLLGSKKLADKFSIESALGKGTTITWTKWDRH